MLLLRKIPAVSKKLSAAVINIASQVLTHCPEVHWVTLISMACGGKAISINNALKVSFHVGRLTFVRHFHTIPGHFFMVFF